MSAPALVAAIDQGTTGTTVLLLDPRENVVARAYREIPQSYPAPGWVEHDPESIWRSVTLALREALAALPHPADVAAVGLTNQRETVVLWDRHTGAPVAPAIVWQDRRTSDACGRLRDAGHEGRLQALTGLLVDPYFSATKVAWLLDETPGLRARAEAGDLAFGTVDSYLVWKLSGGRSHVTDVSNAARTQLFDIHRLAWSEELCQLFGVPLALLPRSGPCTGRLAQLEGVEGLDDGIAVTGMAGDQQAALFGQGCVNAGDAKCTFGTGSFLLMNVGDSPVVSQRRLLTTVAWSAAGHTQYAMEGGAFVCGALVQWLRDGLGLIDRAAEVEALAASVPDSAGVTIVPAFTGLGAPHWKPQARGTIGGLTRGTHRGHLARAALEAMALQNVDIVRAMEADAGRKLTVLRVDGGASSNDLLMQIQADLLGVPIERPAMLESTALGAGRLAAVGAGLRPWPGSPEHKPSSGLTRFSPRLSERDRLAVYERWQDAVSRTTAERAPRAIP